MDCQTDTDTTWYWPTATLIALLAGEEELKGVRLSHPCFALPKGDETFCWWCVLWVLWCLLFVFVFVCLVVLFLFVLFYELSHSLLLHTQVVESFLVSVEGHWTCVLTYVFLRRVSLRLLNLDCRYPRDLLQPARKKKDDAGRLWVNVINRSWFISVEVNQGGRVGIETSRCKILQANA